MSGNNGKDLKVVLASAEFPALSGSSSGSNAPSRRTSWAAMAKKVEQAGAPATDRLSTIHSANSAVSGSTATGTHSSVKSVEDPPFPKEPEEIQRVRKQIEDMADQLRDAFANEKYEDVKLIGEKKKELEEKLKKFEEQYSNDKVLHELQTVKEEISKVDEDMKAAFESESYSEVAELGRKKKELQTKLADLESNFGLHNAVYQVGDRVSVVGLRSPRGGTYNGLEGTVTEYVSEKREYNVVIKSGEGEKSISLAPQNLTKARPASGNATPQRKSAVNSPRQTPRRASTGQSQTRQLIGAGEIKLWFPRKHFGFIMPDNKPEDEPDIFFHGTHVENRKEMPIKRFARVKFSVIPAPKGPQARDVTITDYQPEKEAAAEEAEAAKQAESGKPTRPEDELKKKRKKKNKASPNPNSQDGPRGSQFRREINIEDSLERLAPAKLGFQRKRDATFPRSPSLNRRSPNRSPSRNPFKAKQQVSQGNLYEIRDSRKVKSKPMRSNRDAHRNWGSISSEMGSMRWDDSIKSVSEFFHRSAGRSNNGPDAANRPPMSIQGRRRPRNNRDLLTSSLRNFANAAEVLTAAANAARAAAAAHENMNGGRESQPRHSVPELRRKASDQEPRRSVDLSRNKSLDLRRSTSSGSAQGASPLNTLKSPQESEHNAQSDASDEMTKKNKNVSL